MARPTKLTAETQEKIVQAIRAGNYIETAAAYAGIDKKSLYTWLKRGNECPTGTNIHAKFLQAVEQALATAEAQDVLIIGKAAKEGAWQASAWRLERKFPDRWGRKDTHRFTDEFSKLSDDELVNRAKSLLLGSVAAGEDAPDPAAG
jgi:transposase